MCINHSLVSADHSLVSINQIKIILKLTKNWTKLNQGLQRLSLETEISEKFIWVKPRLDKLNQNINQD